MLFNSYQFLFAFLPLTLLVCFLLAHNWGAGAAQFAVIAASLLFYSFWNVAYVPLLLGSIVFNYWIAQRMIRADRPRHRTAMLALAVAVDLGLLGYYKYTNYLLATINTAFGTHLAVVSIALPLGISFYTFQQIMLLVDVSRGQIRDFRFRDFLLFVVFFPHLIAGPIVHHREMMPQFEKAQWRFDWRNMAVGLALLAAGLFKKTVLADGIATEIAPIFAGAAGEPVSFFYAWAAALGFTLQLYFDFSGYSEMALGLARMLGIRLPMNFNSPLKSSSIIEFWTRWHITLSRFLTAYIYNPMVMALARRRMAKGRTIIAGSATTAGAFAILLAFPTMTTMLLAGIWHGAGNQFVIVGLLFGGCLVINHAWRAYRPRFWKDNVTHARVMQPVGFVLTFCGVMVTLTFFHAQSVTAATNIVVGMTGAHGILLPEVVADRAAVVADLLAPLGVRFAGQGLNALLTDYVWIAVLLLLALVPPNVLQIMREYDPALNFAPATARRGRSRSAGTLETLFVWRPTARWAALGAVVISCGILAMSRVSEFLYWQF